MQRAETGRGSKKDSSNSRGRPKKRTFSNRKVRLKNQDTIRNVARIDEQINKRRKKVITLEELLKLGQINILSVATDLGEQECADGPWQYLISKNCIVRFTLKDSDFSYAMRLDNLLERGIPSTLSSSLVFRWYSWIRFKAMAKLRNVPINSALSDENQFISILHEVNEFYTRNPYACKEDGLEPNRGPQSFADSFNLEYVHYYGKGTINYYRKSTLLHLVGQKYGENVKAEYLVEPTTSLIDATDYEEILMEVHRELTWKYWRHLNKLEKFAGPQCNEDRIHYSKINYDVKFTSASSKAKSDLKADPISRVNHELPSNEIVLSEFYLRKCHVCYKVRWLGKRAAEKFVLGSYSYGEVDRQVHFSCNLLHDTSCDEEDDIVSLSSNEPCPRVWVAYDHFQGSKLPPVAFVMKTLRCASLGQDDVEVLAKYVCTNHELSIFNYKAICTNSLPLARVNLGHCLTTGRFQRFAEIPTLSQGKLNRTTPRQALVCQSWLDKSQLSSEDLNAHYSVTNLCGVRDLHAAYDAMKMIHCSQCGMCSPGFEAEVDECITVPVAGQHVPLSDRLLLTALKQSKILSRSSVTLDFAFSKARVYKDETVTGICTTCSKFCEIDDDGNVTLLHKKSLDCVEQSSQDTASSQQPLDDNISNINPYSAENLMALDVFQNEASYQYAMFMDTLSQAEKLVLSPIHAVIVILRSRTNNVPFSRYGSISFAIKQPVKTTALPWHTFQQLPFVIMVSKHEDGSVIEAKVNMAKIVHAKELMEREVTCPVNGTNRPFYRYCDKIHTPFTTTAMECLASQLSDTSTAVLPNGLRKINVDLIHERASKRLTLPLFSEWINSGFTIGSGIKDAFLIETYNSQTSSLNQEAIVNQIWDVFSNFVKKKPTDESNEPLHVTLTDVVMYGVQKSWLDPSTDIANASQKTLKTFYYLKMN